MEKPRPPNELLLKIAEIAFIKVLTLDAKERALSSKAGLYVWADRLPGDRWLIRAGPRSIFAKLIYVMDQDGHTTIKKYQPGDWEAQVDATLESTLELQKVAQERLRRAADRWKSGSSS